MNLSKEGRVRSKELYDGRRPPRVRARRREVPEAVAAPGRDARGEEALRRLVIALFADLERVVPEPRRAGLRENTHVERPRASAATLSKSIPAPAKVRVERLLPIERARGARDAEQPQQPEQPQQAPRAAKRREEPDDAPGPGL